MIHYKGRVSKSSFKMNHFKGGYEMNVGTIGTGEITSWFLTCWKESGNTCYATYSRSKTKAEALKQKFQGEKAYSDLELFLADEKMDVVYIASPNSLHFSHAKNALFANKHVILEKPFTSTVWECSELIKIAKDRNLFLMEGITVVDLPNKQLLASLLSKIGNIHMISTNMSKVSSKYEAFLRGEKPNVFLCAFSGGALMDLNVYNVHLMVSLFGMPQAVYYVANTEEGLDTSGCLTLTYANHIAQCISAKDSEANNYVEIQGEKGYIYINSAAATLSSIELHVKNEDVAIYHNQEHTLTHIYYIQAFVNMVKDNNVQERDKRLLHTLHVMQILQKARAIANIVFEADQ